MGKYLDMIRQAEQEHSGAPESSGSAPKAVSKAGKVPPEEMVAEVAPVPPLQSGWIVTYTDRQGCLCGGWDERDKATVSRCVWAGTAWMVELSSGQSIPLLAVRAVGQINAEGRLIAAWTVRGCGYDGQGKEPYEKTTA